MKIRKVEKLVPNIKVKKVCQVHIKDLNQSLKHDLKLKRSIGLLGLKKSFWMKPYMIFNTKLRTTARNGFEKELFKLMNNSIFWRDHGKY